MKINFIFSPRLINLLNYLADFPDGLNRAHFGIYVHKGNKNRVRLNRLVESFQINHTIFFNRQISYCRALGLKPAERL